MIIRCAGHTGRSRMASFAGAVDNPTSTFDAFAGFGLVFSGRRTDLV
jgi:hypothetical protein